MIRTRFIRRVQSASTTIPRPIGEDFSTTTLNLATTPPPIGEDFSTTTGSTNATHPPIGEDFSTATGSTNTTPPPIGENFSTTILGEVTTPPPIGEDIVENQTTTTTVLPTHSGNGAGSDGSFWGLDIRQWGGIAGGIVTLLLLCYCCRRRFCGSTDVAKLQNKAYLEYEGFLATVKSTILGDTGSTDQKTKFILEKINALEKISKELKKSGFREFRDHPLVALSNELYGSVSGDCNHQHYDNNQKKVLIGQVLRLINLYEAKPKPTMYGKAN
jgi:hypothetical protein